jgi:hypothetical protein
LGHALYMKAIHGGKTKNDRIDSHKIAVFLRGGPHGLCLSCKNEGDQRSIETAQSLYEKAGRTLQPHPEHSQPV